MSTILKTLYEFTSQSLDPKALASRSLTANDFASWTTFMSQEGAELRLEIVDNLMSTAPLCEKQIWLTALQHQLVFISNLLNNFLFRRKQQWQSHPSGRQIRMHYHYSLSLVEDLLDFASDMFPDHYDYNQKLTDFRLKEILPPLRKVMSGLTETLADRGISAVLSQIVICGLKVVLDNQPSVNDARYIWNLYDTVQAHSNLDDHSLTVLLTKLDFNQPEFFLYQIAVLDKRLFEVHGLHEQRELLSQEKYLLLKIRRETRHRLHLRQSPLLEDLIQYLQEREEAIGALLEIRRAAARDKVSPDQAFRILMDMTVPQLALFFRIQMEVGLLIKEQISEVFNFVAQHFYTEKAHYISSGNMLKLSTTIEFNTVLKVYDMLSTMTKWLDEQFGVSNYKR